MAAVGVLLVLLAGRRLLRGRPRAPGHGRCGPMRPAASSAESRGDGSTANTARSPTAPVAPRPNPRPSPRPRVAGTGID